MDKESGNIPDGHHTFNELYDHRTVLFITLCKILKESRLIWRSRVHHTDDTEILDGVFIMGIGIEAGKQISYHLKLSYWDATDFAETYEQAPKWDGHTPEDVLGRLRIVSR